ncbi:MAG TPA: peptidoglycan DD-metalloendopeptidase family protein [Gemmatimonadales bacterium]|nr:peptidoglycan DD-metalloendopeptidase family protein [Gemmatimonadales bacterium]
MTAPIRRYVTLMIHRDGALTSPTLRLPVWLARVVSVTAVAVAVAVLMATISYAPVARLATRVPALEREVERLRVENDQVRDLAARLVELEGRYEQVRTMLGGDLVPRRIRPDSLAVAHPVLARLPGPHAVYESGPTVPRHWPLDEAGVVTRGQVGSDAGQEVHPGLDIAVPSGTPIRAAGGGTIAETGDDPEYGKFVLIEHPEGFQTLYGHASRLLVGAGDIVSAGQVIGLSGSTGRSTAPHLHFETRQGGRPVDPRPLLRARGR